METGLDFALLGFQASSAFVFPLVEGECLVCLEMSPVLVEHPSAPCLGVCWERWHQRGWRLRCLWPCCGGLLVCLLSSPSLFLFLN